MIWFIGLALGGLFCLIGCGFRLAQAFRSDRVWVSSRYVERHKEAFDYWLGVFQFGVGAMMGAGMAIVSIMGAIGVAFYGYKF